MSSANAPLLRKAASMPQAPIPSYLSTNVPSSSLGDMIENGNDLCQRFDHPYEAVTDSAFLRLSKFLGVCPCDFMSPRGHFYHQIIAGLLVSWSLVGWTVRLAYLVAGASFPMVWSMYEVALFDDVQGVFTGYAIHLMHLASFLTLLKPDVLAHADAVANSIAWRTVTFALFRAKSIRWAWIGGCSSVLFAAVSTGLNAYFALVEQEEIFESVSKSLLVSDFVFTFFVFIAQWLASWLAAVYFAAIADLHAMQIDQLSDTVRMGAKAEDLSANEFINAHIDIKQSIHGTAARWQTLLTKLVVLWSLAVVAQISAIAAGNSEQVRGLFFSAMSLVPLAVMLHRAARVTAMMNQILDLFTSSKEISSDVRGKVCSYLAIWAESRCRGFAVFSVSVDYVLLSRLGYFLATAIVFALNFSS